MIADAAIRVCGGVVPLDINALIDDLLHEVLVGRHISRIHTGFLVNEVTIKTIVLGNLHQLVSHRIGAVGTLALKQVLIGLFSSVVARIEDRRNRLRAILVRDIGICGIRQIQRTELKPFLSPVRLGLLVVEALWHVRSRLTMPGTVIIRVLPVVEQVLREHVVVVERLEERVAVVASKVEHLRIGRQVRVFLRRGVGGDAGLQRYTGAQVFRVLIRVRVPVQNIQTGIAMLIWLVGSRRLLRMAGIGILASPRHGVGGACRCGQCRQRGHRQHRCQARPQPFPVSSPGRSTPSVITC